MPHPSSPPRRAADLPGYAELLCRSNFSFLTGASHPEELVARAQVLGYAALAITDECTFAGIVRAHVAAKALPFKLIIGTQMRLDLSPPAPSLLALSDDEDDRALAAQAAARQPPLPEAPLRLLLLAQDAQGYRMLSQWITVARRRAPKGRYRAETADVEGRTPDAPQLGGLPGCHVLLVLDHEAASAPADLLAQALWLRHWVGPERCSLGLVLQRRADDARLVAQARALAAQTGLPIAALGDVLMHVRSRKALQDVLTATRLKCTVAEAGLALQPNAEAHLRSRLRLSMQHDPAWLRHTLTIAERCRFSLDSLRYQYPSEVVPAGHTPTSWLRELTEQGARRRFPNGLTKAVRHLIEHELALIKQLEYEAYFLTVAEIVQWARSKNILCQGRGSAANSVVCYCLEVTAVDPEKNQMLLFERFISAQRNEPPDIDVDFEHQRREEVIEHIYQKYGRHRTALTAVVTSYRPRSALRDVGRALGLDLDRITAVSKGQHWFDGRRIAPERLLEHGIDPASRVARQWVELTQQLIGFPRHLSQHPGGFLIARDHIEMLVPVENAAMEGRTVVQWDKDDLDALKLIKVDILALGMLSALRRGLALVGAKLGRALELHQVPQEDPVVYDMLGRADSVGVFQVESRAQMSMLPRLRPRCYYDLVIEVAIVRPGPIQGGMVHPYLRRRNGEEPIDIPRDELKPALERTKGIPIFQEQVMQIAMIAAEFSAGEADQLRRAMAAWKRRGGLGPFHERLVGRMVQRGYEREFAERIFKQMEGFGEYGFPESHAASFALLVYASAWIKCHHPDAFLAALLDSQPMGFYAPAQLVRDAREHGVAVLPVDVTCSAWTSELEGAAGAAGGPLLRAVRLGLGRIHGFPQAAAQRLVAARDEAPFASVEDLARRAALDEHQLGLLARADALHGLSGHRHQAAWAAAGVDTRAVALLRDTRTHEAAAELAAPALGQTLVADYRATGLSLQAHPLALLRPQLAAFKVQPAAVLHRYPDGRLARASGLVTHRQRPETAKGVIFVTLEDETGAVNVIVWPRVAEAQRRPLLASQLLTVYGVWQCQGEVRHLVARRLVDHTPLLQGLSTRSRDFR
ncbi:MAG: error-prone DNA polymerase [Proteobacteria bacterium]|nr:error-prone DNA polymerase [Pseudomonadota bacterium]